VASEIRRALTTKDTKVHKGNPFNSRAFGNEKARTTKDTKVTKEILLTLSSDPDSRAFGNEKATTTKDTKVHKGNPSKA
jgi:hypothetical protein